MVVVVVVLAKQGGLQEHLLQTGQVLEEMAYFHWVLQVLQ